MISTRFPRDVHTPLCYAEGTMHGQEEKDELADETSEISQTSEVWQPDYMSYLLRLWRVGQSRGAHWRASLQRPGTEKPLWFADLEEMFAFLRAQTGDVKRG